MEYVPEKGDVVWLSFDPRLGHEQAGYRPALVLTPSIYNEKAGTMLCCPITSRKKGYPFQIELEGNPDVSGMIMTDQLTCIDWRARVAKKKGVVGGEVLQEVQHLLEALLF
ncbi:endoribonuclease MazF [bacterium]|nr:MAG: endoribonuclease MazF [bacterium]